MRLTPPFLALVLLPWIASAHVGSPNVFFEGQAGPYPVRVVVRPPEVVPGLAEISIRVEGGGVGRVTALPVFWNAGRKGAPPPDLATLVRGETNLYATNLWLMKSGAYSVNVAVEGARGGGSVVVPVNSLALTRRSMPVWFGAMLIAIGVALFIGAVRIAGATFGEATVAPGAAPSPADRRRSRLAMAIATVVFAVLLGVGRAWWDKEDSNYRNNRLFKPQPVSAKVRREDGHNILRIEVEHSVDRRSDWPPLIPDHGKMMHLFLIREPGLDAFAHIHPSQRDRWTFDVALPPLPPGTYRAYADVTHENGFAQTLVASAQVPEPNAPDRANRLLISIDPDDSWHTDAPGPVKNAASVSPLTGGGEMVWEKHAPLRENVEAPLHFRVLDAAGRAMALQPYMGMLGHAAIHRDDGTVFAHLHPVGSISMASQEFFAEDVPVDHSQHLVRMRSDDNVSFPYEFPKAGRYRIWVQVKSSDRVLTGVFDAEVLAAQK